MCEQYHDAPPPLPPKVQRLVDFRLGLLERRAQTRRELRRRPALAARLGRTLLRLNARIEIFSKAIDRETELAGATELGLPLLKRRVLRGEG